MELRQLRYFVALAERLHFGAAARQLEISQPTLSQQLRALEAELGTRLVERETRRIALTAAGDVLLEHATEILARVDAAVDRTRAAAGSEVGRLRVGYVFCDIPDHPVRIVEEFKRRYPMVRLDLVRGDTETRLRLLRAGEVDAAFLRVIHPPDDPALQFIPLYREPLVLVLPIEHPLASKDTVSAADLDRQRFVFYPREQNTELFRRVHQAFADAGMSVETVYEARDEMSLLPAVLNLCAFSLFSTSKARLVAYRGIQYRSAPFPGLTVGLGLAVRRSPTSAATRALAAIAQAL